MFPTVESDLKDIQRKIDQKKRIIKRKRTEVHQTKRSIGQLMRQLRYTELALKNQKHKLRKAERAHRQSQLNLTQLKKDYHDTRQAFQDKLINIYKFGNIDFIQVFFAQDDLMVSQDIQHLFKELLHSDVALFSELKLQHEAIKKEEYNFRQQKAQAKRLKEQVQKKERRLVQRRNQKNRYLKVLSKDIKKLERHVGVLQSSSRELMGTIDKMDLKKNVFYGTGSMVRPVRRSWISSRFGIRRHPISKRRLKHNGIDFAAPTGYKIKASDSGVVIVAGQKRKYRGYGKVTVLDHGLHPGTKKRMITVYAHQSRIFVNQGDIVRKGDVIGLVGSTGYSTGPHLHFEVRLDGKPVNPIRYVRI